MVMTIDGERILDHALWDGGQGWTEAFQQWRYQCTRFLRAGAHDIVFESVTAISAIRAVALVPVAVQGDAPDADERARRSALPEIARRPTRRLSIPESINFPLYAKSLADLISTEIDANDTAYNFASKDRVSASYHYFSAGASSISAIMACAQLAFPTDIRSVLEFGSAYGRTTRWLRAAFPQADVSVAEVMPDAVAACDVILGTKNSWISDSNFVDLAAPGTYDLIWAGSVFTHLSLKDNKILLWKFYDWLNPGGIAVFSTHGRGVFAKTSGNGYIDEERWNEIKAEYDDTGFGYREYEGQPEWGISMVQPSFMTSLLQTSPGARIICCVEAGWDAHQDVYAFQKSVIC